MTNPGITTSIDSLIALRHGAAAWPPVKKMRAKASNVGQYNSRLRGRGLDFAESRHYQPGDELRSIDWRVTARTQVPHTKVFTEERERPVLIALDQRRAMNFGSRKKFKSVQAAELAATLIWSAQQHGDRVGGFIWNDHRERLIKPKASQASTIRFLAQIVQLNHASAPQATSTDTAVGPSLTSVLQQLRALAKPGTHINLLSDFSDFNEDCHRILFELRKHCDVSIYQIFDKLEKQLPRAGTLKFATTAGLLALDASSDAQRKRFERAARQREEALASSCRKLGMSLITIDTAADLSRGPGLAAPPGHTAASLTASTKR